MSAVRRLVPVIASRPRPLVETLVCNVVVQLGTLGIAAGLALLIGRSLAGHPVHLGVAAAVLAAAAVVTALATWREAMASHDLAYGLIGILRDRIFTSLRRSLPDRRHRRRSGDLTSTALADVETLEWLYAHTVAQTVTAALVLVVTVTGSVLITPWLLLIWVPLLVAGVATPWLTSRVARRQAAALAVDGVALRSDIIDTIQGLRELRGASALDERRRHIAARTSSMTGTQAKVASRLGLERAIADTLLALAAVGALAVAALTHDTLAPELAPWPSPSPPPRSHRPRRSPTCSAMPAPCANRPSGSSRSSTARPPPASPRRPAGTSTTSAPVWSSVTSRSATRRAEQSSTASPSPSVPERPSPSSARRGRARRPAPGSRCACGTPTTAPSSSRGTTPRRSPTRGCANSSPRCRRTPPSSPGRSSPTCGSVRRRHRPTTCRTPRSRPGSSSPAPGSPRPRHRGRRARGRTVRRATRPRRHRPRPGQPPSRPHPRRSHRRPGPGRRRRHLRVPPATEHPRHPRDRPPSRHHRRLRPHHPAPRRPARRRRHHAYTAALTHAMCESMTSVASGCGPLPR